MPVYLIIFLRQRKEKRQMKNKLFTTIIVIMCLVAFSGLAIADWNAHIYVKGQPIEGQFKSSVMIGVESLEKQTPAPPKVPLFSSALTLLSLPAWTPLLIKDIRQAGMERYIWVIAVNPHGNMPGMEDSTCTVSWDPSELGDGSFKLVEGIDETGDVLISDMKITDSFDITGWDRDFYFTIVKE